MHSGSQRKSNRPFGVYNPGALGEFLPSTHKKLIKKSSETMKSTSLVSSLGSLSFLLAHLSMMYSNSLNVCHESSVVNNLHIFRVLVEIYHDKSKSEGKDHE